MEVSVYAYLINVYKKKCTSTNMAIFNFALDCYIQLWPKGQAFSLLSVSTDLHK